MTARSSLARRRQGIETVVVGGILLVIALAAGYAILHGRPLGWDESVYASKARSLVTSLPAPVWPNIRPPGLPVLATLAAPFGFTDLSLRGCTLLLGLLTLAAVWALTRRLWGPVAAVIALLAVGGSPIVIRQITLFHNDLPSAGLLLLLMLLLWDQFEDRPGPTPLVLVAAPLAAVTFYLRYGTLPAIAGIGLTAIGLWHRSMLRHWRLVGVTAAAAIALFLPHILQAVAETGSPLGIITRAVEAVDTTSPQVAIRQYIQWLPSELAGRIGMVMILAGLLHAALLAARAVRDRRITVTVRRYLWLYLPAAIAGIALVLVSHPERRYMLFPLLLGIVAGGGAVAATVDWARTRAAAGGGMRRRSRADGVIVVLVVLLAVAVGYSGGRRLRTEVRHVGDFAFLMEVGRAIKADAGGRPCVVATTIPPKISWYSGCNTIAMRATGLAPLQASPATLPVYVVFTELDPLRASPDLLARYHTVAEPRPIATVPAGASTPKAEVYRLAR